MIMTPDQIVDQFYNTYNNDLYYIPAEKTDKADPNKPGKIIYNYKFNKIAINKAAFIEHLITGSKVVTIGQLNKDNQCKWGVIDIDEYSPDFVSKVKDKIYSNKYPLNIVQSVSGGLHLYLYSQELISGALMRNALAYYRDRLELKPETEIFPKQTELTKDTPYGNMIKLPFASGIDSKEIQTHLKKAKEFAKPTSFFENLPKIIVDENNIETKSTKETLTVNQIKQNINNNVDHPEGGTWDNWITLLIAKFIGLGKTDKQVIAQCLSLKHEDHTVEETTVDIKAKLARARDKFKVEEPEQVRKRFLEEVVYLLDPCKYFDLKKNKEYRPDAIKQSWSALMGVSDATIYFKNYRSKTLVEDFIYDPIKYNSINPIIELKGLKYINKYRPNSLEPIEGDISLFETLMNHLFIDETAKEFILDYISIHIQQPGVKCRFAPIIQSTEFQIGKGSLWRCIKLMLGANAQKVDVKEALDKAKDFLQSRQIVLIDEMKSSGKWEEREEILNEFKLFITEEEQSQRKLFIDYKAIITCTNFIFFTNFKNALTLPENEQRYWVYFCDVPRLNQIFYRDFHKWLEGVGKNNLLYYFKNRIISDVFDPKDVAPKSLNLIDMSKQAQRPLMAELEDRFNEMLPPFQDFRDLIPTTWLMAWCKKNKIKVSRPNDLFPILERLGGVNIGQCEMTKARSGGGQSKHKLTIWIMRNHEKYTGMSNREIGQKWMDDYLSVDDGINLFDDATNKSNYTDRGNH